MSEHEEYEVEAGPTQFYIVPVVDESGNGIDDCVLFNMTNSNGSKTVAVPIDSMLEVAQNIIKTVSPNFIHTVEQKYVKRHHPSSGSSNVIDFYRRK